MTRCEEVKKFKYEFRNLKEESKKQLNLLPFIVKIINFVENSNSSNIEPYPKVKMFYNTNKLKISTRFEFINLCIK